MILLLFLAINLTAQTEIKLSDDLTLYQLSKHCYEHTQNNNNGLIYINNGEAVIVSTPDSDEDTQKLIDWVRNEKQANIVAYVIDRYHPDAMQGLDVVQQNGIKSYACKRTQRIAKEKGLPVAKIGFKTKKVIQVGDEKVICHYLGEAHTKDGIVVYVPGEKILFGGNEIRNYNGWVGNIGDANIYDWSQTATNVKKEYGEAKIVVPGHGKFGGAELIDYTIQLFADVKRVAVSNPSNRLLDAQWKTSGEFFSKADSITFSDGKELLKNGVMVVQDVNKFIVVEAPEITYQPTKKRVDSPSGRVKIYDKTNDGEILRTDVRYERLMIYKYDEKTVGFVVVLKKIKKL